MPISPRSVVANIVLPPHGGMDHAELVALGVRPADVVDFSANLSPFAAPPGVAEAMRSTDPSRYPDGESVGLRRALAGRLGVPADSLIAGNGSSELLWLIALAFVESGDRVLIAGPTFGEYERAARLMGAEVEICPAQTTNDFRHDVRRLAQQVSRWSPKVVFLCNPNNPTGAYLGRDAVGHIAAQMDEGLLVLDEAYIDFVDAPWSSLDLLGTGVLVVRSLTKSYGLAGVRLGYAVGEASTIADLRKVRPPWNVNALAQAAGVVCANAGEHAARSRAELGAAKDFLVSELRRVGLRVVPSDTTFFLVEVGDAREFRAGLLRRGLLVRDCTSFGLPGFIRIAAQRMPDCRRLIEAIAELAPGRTG